MILHERFETLQLQVDALKNGTNPIVFFPKDTPQIPKAPDGMRIVRRSLGTFYANPSIISEKMIDEALKKKLLWALLGFVQSKKEALESGTPIAVVARSAEGREIKTAVVDSSRQDLVSMQVYFFYQFFPESKVSAEPGYYVIAERLQGDIYASEAN